MKGVTIADKDDDNVLTFDLVDILRLAGDRGIRSRWKLANVEALGGNEAEELHLNSDRGMEISGQRLLELSAHISQVIDGDFEGFEDGCAQPWIVISAVDSSAYDVRTNDPAVIERIRTRFRSVNDLP